MLLYFVKRIFLGILIIGVAMTLMFFMIHLVPGDPARIMLGPRATPEMIADISMRMGLDQPLVIQLMKFLGSILKGGLGN